MNVRTRMSAFISLYLQKCSLNYNNNSVYGITKYTLKDDKLSYYGFYSKGNKPVKSDIILKYGWKISYAIFLFHFVKLPIQKLMHSIYSSF